MADTVHSSDEIQRQMAALRRALEQDVGGVVTSARTLGDWRYHFREHPALFSAAAAALGFVLVPRRSDPARFVVSYVNESGAENHSAVCPDGGAPSSRPILAALLGLVANAVARHAATVVARHGRDLLDGFLAARARPKPSELVSPRHENLSD